MRIVGGKYKGKRIAVSKSFKARPTTDFAKENIFNIIENEFDIPEIDVLDLFSGTGSISYEFCSRGANKVIAAEMNQKSVIHTRQFADELGFSQLEVHRADAFRLLKKTDHKFDLIFADPPYQLKNLDTLPNLVFENDLLKNNGWLILEHGHEYNFRNAKNYAVLRKYGSVHFSIFKK